MLLYFLENESFKLITFRASLSAILAFVVALLLGPRIIAWLKRMKIGEKIEKGDSRILDEKMKHKKDTPTMGGIFIVLSVVLSILLCASFENLALLLVVALLIALGCVGGYDDYLKMSGKCKTGMSFFAKLLCQCVIGLLCGVALCWILQQRDTDVATMLYFPIFPTDFRFDLGPYYPIFVMFVIVACSNAVNVTDGLDGLASGCLAIACFAYAIIAYVAGRYDYTAYLDIPYVKTSAETTIACTAMLGACLGFLWFNGYPAQIFMGDVGSLPIGGALGLVACITKQELLLLFVGGVFVVEILSSLLQIVGFKMTGKRIFRCAPLHHHFQFMGLGEPKIIIRFWIIAAICAVASLSLLKLRF